MAKELPYFQFEPAEYLTKDISFCSLAAQGLFSNLCAYYWQRNCKLTTTQFLRRINEADLFNELLSEGVVDLDGDDIIIKFLDVQFEKATKTSKTNTLNGKKGGRPKKEKTETKPKQNPNESETKGIREDKIRKDNTLSIEVEVEDSKVKSIVYEESDFLKNWNEVREHFLKTDSNLNRLSPDEKDLFYQLKDQFHKKDFHDGLKGLFQQETIPRDVMWFKPKHFLGNIETYIDAQNNKRYKLYGS